MLTFVYVLDLCAYSPCVTNRLCTPCQWCPGVCLCSSATAAQMLQTQAQALNALQLHRPWSIYAGKDWTFPSSELMLARTV